VFPLPQGDNGDEVSPGRPCAPGDTAVSRDDGAEPPGAAPPLDGAVGVAGHGGLVPQTPRPAFEGRPHGPVMATVYPGVWMLANSVLPEALNTGPQNSLSFSRLRASG
jgi:hypothetical protein